MRIISVIDKRFGDADHPLHLKVTDPSGESIVIEVVENGKVKVYDVLLGVVANSPTYGIVVPKDDDTDRKHVTRELRVK